MQPKRRVSVVKIAVIGAAVPALLYAISTGPPPSRTGAPGEGTCRECHDGGSGGGKLEIRFPGQLVYSPGVKQSLTVTITDADAQRYGFELSVRVAADNSQAGTLAPAPGESAIRVICRDFALRPAGGCPASAPIEYIEHSIPRQTNTFNIEWVPPASDVGTVKIYVAANAANGNGLPTGDDIYTNSYTLAPQGSVPGNGPSFNSAGIVNSATLAAGISPGAFLTIRGQNLAPLTRNWDGAIEGTALPEKLEGVSVTVGGKPAYLAYISPVQLNVLLSTDDMTGSVEVRVGTPQGSAGASAVMDRYAPGWFPSGLDAKYVAATHGDGVPVAEVGLTAGVTSRPARPGEEIALWGTGFGPTAESVPSGQVLSKAYLLANPADLRVTLGGRDARVTFAGVTFAGVYQINVVVPPDLVDGDHVLLGEIGAVRTQNNALLTVQRLPQDDPPIQVSFRLDPWLISGNYLGGLWVSPPVLGPTTQGGDTFIIDARAHGLDATGQAVDINPLWIPADSGMVTVAPRQGSQVTITVRRAGQSRLSVVAQGVSKELIIQAVISPSKVLLVEITQ